jgi:small subunit ribosomal protein S20
MSALRTQLRKTLVAAEAGDKSVASTELAKSSKALDRAAQKGLIHKNQAARRKSRLSARVDKLDG